MADYGHGLRFGTFLPPDGDTLRLAALTEELGLDLTSVQDHPYQARFLDAWTVLSVIAARTSRITVFPNVANVPLRPPAVLARAAASLDILSDGRVELGLGAGSFWDAIEAMGGPARTPAASIEALDEAVRVIRALWSEDRSVRVDGTHYRIRGARPGPRPPHPIGIWIGGIRPRMLGLVGRVADGWIPSAPYLPPDRLTDANRRVDDAATAAGRDPRDIVRLYNVVPGQPPLDGPPREWPQRLAELAVTEGMSTFILMLQQGSDRLLRMFAEDVVPATKALVSAARGLPAPPDRAAAPDESSGGRAALSDGSLAGGAGESASDRAAVTVWDESTRPTGPAAALDDLTPAQLASGRHLVDVHDHLRDELAQLRDLIEQVAAGTLDAGAARSAVNTMTMRQNTWTLGTYCETYCRVVTTHHSIEDRALFPRLRSADRRLAPVVDRLEAEHHVIADVLERVDAALVAMVTRPDGLKQVREAVDLLATTLLSHLAYEERELVGPLSRLAIF